MVSSRRRAPTQPGPPERLADALTRYLKSSGIADRVKQMSVLEQWAELVGPEIAAVTQPRSIGADGTIFVGVRSHGWMTELTLMEADLLLSLNRASGPRPLKKIRWSIMP
jgi:predicted nucleic acid-binding Zn ribbon protein